MALATMKEQFSDDIFADTRMSFGDHIEDLRSHLLRAIYGFLIALLFSFFIGDRVLGFIARPVEIALTAYWERYWAERSKQVLETLGQGGLQAQNEPIPIELYLPRSLFRPGQFDGKTGDKAVYDISAAGEQLVKIKTKLINPIELFARSKAFETIVGRRPTLSTLRAEEAFMVWIKVCLVTGFVLASPWVFYQLWSFIAAGLYPHEKKYVNIYMPFSIGLFIVGVVFCEWVVLPKAVEALLWFNEWLGLEPDLRLNEWLGFAIIMPVMFGAAFQTPLIMLFLQRLGVLPIETMRKNRLMAWFIMCIIAAVITPSPDAFSMMYLWIPLGLLYELGIILCRMRPANTVPDDEDGDSGALVEV